MTSFWGDPGTSKVIQTPGSPSMRPPGFQFAQWLFKQLPGLMNTPYPTYQGQLDPGLSPTMQDSIRRAQGYAESSPPEILAGINGSLGRFMSPSFVNPWNTLWRGGGPGYSSPGGWGAQPGGWGSGNGGGSGWPQIGPPDQNGNRMGTGPGMMGPSSRMPAVPAPPMRWPDRPISTGQVSPQDLGVTSLSRNGGGNGGGGGGGAYLALPTEPAYRFPGSADGSTGSPRFRIQPYPYPEVPTPNPGFGSPWNTGAPELFGGANNYYQIDPDQRVWGGGRAGSHTYQPGGGGQFPEYTYPTNPQPPTGW